MAIMQTSITTADGDCPSFVLTPEESGSWPAIIFYMDAGGIRPAMVTMAQRLADAGYLVLLPDLFYRHGPYGPLVPEEVFAGDTAAILGPLMASTDPSRAARDTDAFVTALLEREDVAGAMIGAVGFCMGGGLGLASAGAHPAHFAAVASFHGGNLATEKADSPHRSVGTQWAEVHIAAAENDDSYPPAMAERLEQSLGEAGVTFTAKTYPAAHGWMIPDFPSFDAAEAGEGWKDMLTLFARTLNPAV